MDGTGLRQLTFPPPDEQELVQQYRLSPLYHHGTDDMQPCYLPDFRPRPTFETATSKTPPP